MNVSISHYGQHIWDDYIKFENVIQRKYQENNSKLRKIIQINFGKT